MDTSTPHSEYKFDVDRFFPIALYQKITEIRINAAEVIWQQAQARKRRARLTLDGKLTILAADHPARGVTRIGDMPYRMADRYRYLGRILRVLLSSGFDGFMSTPDMIEELFILDYLLGTAGQASFLDDRVLVGCMQRGGAAGVKGEIDDRFTAYTAESLHKYRLEGGKMMFRFVPEDERTLWTIDYCARAVTDLNRYDLVPFIEALRMDFQGGKWEAKNYCEELIPLVGIIAGLGDSSRNLWMKLPYCAGFERVSEATTAPILLLGGSARDNPEPLYQEFASGLGCGNNVRGALVGRNVTYPGDEDPGAVAQAVWSIVHERISPEAAMEVTMANRNRDIDLLQELRF